MASNTEDDDSSVSPSFSMKLVLETVRIKFSDVMELSTARLDQLRKQEESCVSIFDVREEAEYKVSHIPGAVYVNPNNQDLRQVIDSIKNKGEVISYRKGLDCRPKTVVAYCSLGYRSSQLAQKISQELKKDSELSDTSVYNLTGSLFQWAIEGREMVDNNNKPTVYCHPYNSLFGKLLPYELRKDEP